MKHIVFMLVLICSSLFTESAVVRKIVNNSTILTVPHQESPPNTTFSIGMRGPFIGMPSYPNNTIGENLNGTNGYMVLSNGSLGKDRILASALGDNSNGLNTGFGSFGGVGSGMNSLTDNMAFGQPFGSSGNLFGPGMPIRGGGGGGSGSNLFPGYGSGGGSGGSNLFPGYGYGIPGMSIPGSNGNGYYPGNGFGNNPFPGIIPGYGYGMSPGNWYQPGSPNGNGYGYGYGNWNGNSYGWGNNFGMGVPWYRRAPSDTNATSTTTNVTEIQT